MSEFYQVTPTNAQALRKAKLTASEWEIWSYLVEIDPWGDRYEKVDTLIVISACNVSKATYYRAIAKFQENGLLPKYIVYNEHENPEKQVRDRFHSELGGQTEVITAVGRIDLLTETQIIEVKGFSDWKSALGQILAYSAFFPTHQKRIHLFGNETQLVKLPDVELACLPFAILVTGEVVS